MKIRRNGLTALRLLLRDLKREIFPTKKDDRIKINKAKARARLVDCHELSVIRCLPTIDGCYLRLFCIQNPAEDYSVTVFFPGVANCNDTSLARVEFSETPDVRLFSVYKSSYVWKVGAYLNVTWVMTRSTC
jgi:hypothetical protein